MRTGNTNILISVSPRFAEKIYTGEKTVEVRSRAPVYYSRGIGRDSLRIVFYEHSPVMRITGTAVSRGFRRMFGRDADLSGTCMERSEFESYARGRTLYGFELEDARRFETPLEISVAGYTVPPAAFYILSDEKTDDIISKGATA